MHGGGRRDGDVAQVVERLDVVLRRLRDDGVVHAVLVVEEELGSELGAAAQDIQQAAAYVFFCEAALLGLGAVDVDGKDGIVVGLLDAEVDEAWNLM